MGIIALLILVVLLVCAAADWRVYQKMGFQGWTTLVPVYNTYLLYKATFGNGWLFLIEVLVPVCAGFLSGLLSLVAFPVGYIIGMLLMIAGSVTAMVMRVLVYLRLAKYFGQNAGFGVGLLLVTPVFMMILAFSDMMYGDGSRAVQGSDVFSRVIDRVDAWVRGTKTVA